MKRRSASGYRRWDTSNRLSLLQALEMGVEDDYLALTVQKEGNYRRCLWRQRLVTFPGGALSATVASLDSGIVHGANSGLFDRERALASCNPFGSDCARSYLVKQAPICRGHVMALVASLLPKRTDSHRARSLLDIA